MNAAATPRKSVRALLGLLSARCQLDGALPYWRYRMILGQVPILCVDVLPVRDRADGEADVGLIQRADRHGSTGWAMIGGGVYRNETLDAAIARHVAETLGENVTLDAPAVSSPGLVAQYFTRETEDYGVDPRKHAVALTYWAHLSGTPQALGEAESFVWFPLEELPPRDEFAFGHDKAVYGLREEIRRGAGRPT